MQTALSVPAASRDCGVWRNDDEAYLSATHFEFESAIRTQHPSRILVYRWSAPPEQAWEDFANGQLIARARAGDAIMIVDGQKLLVRLDPVFETSGPRQPGSMKDTLTVPARLMEPSTDDELALFEGHGSR